MYSYVNCQEQFFPSFQRKGPRHIIEISWVYWYGKWFTEEIFQRKGKMI